MAENTTPGSDNLAEGLKDRAAAAVRPADYDELDSDAGPRLRPYSMTLTLLSMFRSRSPSSWAEPRCRSVICWHCPMVL